MNNNVLILLDNLTDWAPYYQTNSLMTVSNYLQYKSNEKSRKLVINLSNNYSYNSEGYYCSLLAQTRGHQVLPGIDIINKLETGTGIRMDMAHQRLCYQWIQNHTIESETWSLTIYFGISQEKGLEKIARFIYEHYPCPILKVTFNKQQRNQIESIQTVPFNQLSDEQQTGFAEALDRFSQKIWHNPRSIKSSKLNLGILYDPSEKMPPSNKQALKKFMEVAKGMRIHTELITEDDANRLLEFDALFIRTTTSLNHYTFHLSQLATQNGLVVIDDPLSIIRCTNKVYLKELFEKEKIPSPLATLLFKSNPKTFDEIADEVGLPFILKVPDGSFSFGMFKINTQEDLDKAANLLFEKSDILLAQAFMPSDFDWRIGLLNGAPLFACKYYMAKGHWQIYRHYGSGISRCGLTETVPLYQVPRKIIDTAVKAASLIGKGLYGVDLKLVNDKAIVIEINDNPSIDHGIEDAVLGDELYYRILDYFERTFNNKDTF
jgi:glutathione synthase/RimK-type ligase-like ATP-grasp enzyme